MLNLKLWMLDYYLIKYRTKHNIYKSILSIYCDLVTKCYLKRYVGKEDDLVVYMFHNISDKNTNPAKYVTNIDDFEQYVMQLLKDKKAVDINSIDGVPKSSFVITFDDGYDGIFKYAYPFLKKMNIPFTLFITLDFIDKPGYLKLHELLWMSHDPLCTIGSHSFSHPLLRFCLNAQNEIKNSKKHLELLIQKKINYFAYPYGSVYACGRKSIKLTKETGYFSAFSSISGRITKKTLKYRYYLPRVNGDPIVARYIRERKNN